MGEIISIKVEVSKIAAKICPNVRVDLTCEIQINWQILPNFCVLHRKPELYELAETLSDKDMIYFSIQYTPPIHAVKGPFLEPATPRPQFRK